MEEDNLLLEAFGQCLPDIKVSKRCMKEFELSFPLRNFDIRFAKSIGDVGSTFPRSIQTKICTMFFRTKPYLYSFESFVSKIHAFSSNICRANAQIFHT